MHGKHHSQTQIFTVLKLITKHHMTNLMYEQTSIQNDFKSSVLLTVL
jgi:hypothetical protein